MSSRSVAPDAFVRGCARSAQWKRLGAAGCRTGLRCWHASLSLRGADECVRPYTIWSVTYRMPKQNRSCSPGRIRPGLRAKRAMETIVARQAVGGDSGAGTRRLRSAGRTNASAPTQSGRLFIGCQNRTDRVAPDAFVRSCARSAMERLARQAVGRDSGAGTRRFRSAGRTNASAPTQA